MKKSKLAKLYKRARDAITGKFITLAEAAKRARTSVIESWRRR